MSDTLTSSLSKTPAIFGEVLFDIFPDGHAVMGGAPFNVAWHLQGLGFSPLMVTAIGDDKNGEAVLSAMQAWGMETSAVQVDKQHPTGQVAVSLQGSIPSYEIITDQAYDYIDAGKSQLSISKHRSNFLYHGSLAVRTPGSQNVLKTLVIDNDLSTFVDINLRDPWWSKSQIENMLAEARWVKLNDEELAIVMGEKITAETNYQALARQCLEKYPLELLIVTLGDKGAFCITADSMEQGAPVKAENIIDTVGAGDSFSAVMIMGLIYKWPLSIALSRALHFASAVCEQRGATSMDHGLYDRFLGQWS